MIFAALILPLVFAACKPTQCTVTFELNGGEMENSVISVEEGTPLDLSAYVPTRAGYVFGGWLDENGGQAELVVIGADRTFKAHWIAAANSVVYFVNGEQYAAEERATGESFTPTAYESESGGEFFGWYYDEALTQKASGSVQVAANGTKLFGRFVDDEYVKNTFSVSLSDSSKARITAVTDKGQAALFIPSVYAGRPVEVEALAFSGVPLERVYVGRQVVLGDGAFAGCGLQAFDGNSEKYYASAGAVYEGNRLMFVLAGADERFFVPERVSDIAAYAFAGCDFLRTVYIPSQVLNVGEKAFADCADDLQIILRSKPASGYATGWNDRYLKGGGAYEYSLDISGTENGYKYRLENGGAYIVDYAGSAEELVLPQTLGGAPLVGVERYAFAGAPLTSVSIPSAVEFVREYAFAECTALETVVFEGTDVSFGASVFNGCSSLSSVRLPSAVSEISIDMFYDCTALREISLPDGLKVIGVGAFEKSGIKVISLPSSLTYIGDRAFAYTGADEPQQRLMEITIDEKIADNFDWLAVTDGMPCVVNGKKIE